MKCMYKIAVMGDSDSIYGFAALGLDIYPVDDADEGKKLLKKLADNDYGIIYLTEHLASQMTEEIDALSDRRLPAVIPIPGVFGNTGIGIRNVKKSVERAVGSDIIFNGDNK